MPCRQVAKCSKLNFTSLKSFIKQLLCVDIYIVAMTKMKTIINLVRKCPADVQLLFQALHVHDDTHTASSLNTTR